MRLLAAVGLSFLLITTSLLAQEKPAAKPPVTTYIHCGTLLDQKTDAARKDAWIVIEDDKIKEVREGGAAPAGANTIDLSKETCLPGLIDAHTHVLLQGDITAEDYDVQLLKQSQAYRAILATQSARKALEYGFTTIRDLETEGAGYADVDIKTAIEKGVIPGPRMKVVTRALDVTGAYPLKGYAPEVPVPHGTQICDGADGCRKAVREQIDYGADWIKVYSDRSYVLRADGVLDDVPTFTPDELRAIVDEAHRERHPVASHAMGLNGVHNSIEAGVDSIEHGDYIADADMKTMVQKGTWYVPTIYVGEYVAEGRGGFWPAMVKVHAETFRKAVQMGVKIAFGTDAGGFDWNIDPAIEFPLMVKYGMTPKQAIRAATVSGSELLRMQDQIGTVEAGKFADIVAVQGDPLADISTLQKIDFVMKGGKVYRRP
jgi:imidazolonepropionase-like amidohydrolase